MRYILKRNVNARAVITKITALKRTTIAKNYGETHIEMRREYSRRWAKAHPEELREAIHRWGKEHPEQRRIHKQTRRARECGLPSKFSSADWQRCLDYFNGCCAACGKAADFWTTIAADHWIPISDPRSDNPGTVITNIVPLCHAKKGVPAGHPDCNHSKNNRNASIWLIERFGKRKAKQIQKRIDAYFEWAKGQG